MTPAVSRSGRRELGRSPLVVVLVVAVSLPVVWWHWIGLPIGGLLLGISAPSLRRAIAYGFGFGGVVLVAFGARLWTNGTLTAVIATGELVGLSALLGLVLPAVTALVFPTVAALVDGASARD